MYGRRDTKSTAQLSSQLPNLDASTVLEVIDVHLHRVHEGIDYDLLSFPAPRREAMAIAFSFRYKINNTLA